MRFYTKQHKYYCGIDLHARSMYICILGKSRPFEHLYRGEFEESVQVIQSEEENERCINIAVSRALNALLADHELLDASFRQGNPNLRKG